MSDLLIVAREHDLPPRWDGRAVLWEGWDEQPMVFICPPPDVPGCCLECGSVERCIINSGLRAVDETITREQIFQATCVTGEMRRAGGPPRLGSIAVRELHVSRCPDCHHDIVFDLATSETWDLDATDYGNAGSVQPERLGESSTPLQRSSVPVPASRRARGGPKPPRRTRPDGSCTACDDHHSPTRPCGAPAPPPSGWRTQGRTTAWPGPVR